MTRTWYLKQEKQVQSGINLDKSAHTHRKGQKRRLQHANAAHFVTEGMSDGELVQIQNRSVAKGYM